MTHLDLKALEAAGVWFGRNFNGLPNSAALVNGLISAYLAALPQAEPVADDDGEAEIVAQQSAENMALIDWISDKIGLPHDVELSQVNFGAWLNGLASPTPVVSREDVEEECAKVADQFTCGACGADGKAAAAIRALSQPHSEK